MNTGITAPAECQKSNYEKTAGHWWVTNTLHYCLYHRQLWCCHVNVQLEKGRGQPLTSNNCLPLFQQLPNRGRVNKRGFKWHCHSNMVATHNQCCTDLSLWDTSVTFKNWQVSRVSNNLDPIHSRSENWFWQRGIYCWWIICTTLCKNHILNLEWAINFPKGPHEKLGPTGYTKFCLQY